MNPKRWLWILSISSLAALLSCSTSRQNPAEAEQKPSAAAMAQVPTWSRDDLDFFLHGSMSTEVVPEAVLRAFIRTYPDLFPREDLSHLGLIPDPAFGWPVGFSRKNVPHLGGLSAVGVNCASCHVGEVTSASGGAPVRVLGMTSHFDAEAYFGAVIGATFRTETLANMKKFLTAYVAQTSRDQGRVKELFEAEWQQQEQKIRAVIPLVAVRDLTFYPISESDLVLNQRNLESGADLAAVAQSMLKLFHNMRFALHVPDQPPDKAPPASGPSRNDAFGLLSAVLFGEPQPYGPVKYGLVWNVQNRHWVHWDGNTQSPIGRNLLASLGLGAPLVGKHGELDFALVKRQTDLSERIRPPRYPFAIDEAAAKRGLAHYQSRCAACHDGPENDQRLHAPSEIGTDPGRAAAFTPPQAGRFNKFLAELETAGYQPSQEPGIRSTQKYWAASMAGVWARSPYLHNGSVRTMRELLAPPAQRAKSFHRGSRDYDTAQMGYTNEGAYVLDTSAAGNSNAGHDYGTDLSTEQKRELIEFLKTL